MAPLQHNESFNIWYDKKISPGKKFDGIIKSQLSASHLAILLISNDYFESNYIKKNELPIIANNVKIIPFPVIVKPCHYEEVPWLQNINCIKIYNTNEKKQDTEIYELVDKIIKIKDEFMNNN